MFKRTAHQIFIEGNFVVLFQNPLAHFKQVVDGEHDTSDYIDYLFKLKNWNILCLIIIK